MEVKNWSRAVYPEQPGNNPPPFETPTQSTTPAPVPEPETVDSFVSCHIFQKPFK